MKKIKSMSILLAVCLILAAAAGGATAAFAEDMADSSTDVSDGEINYGYVSLPQDYDVYDEGEFYEEIPPLAASYTDAAYQWYSIVKTKYPWTRDQNPYGVCWAFAATACAEFDLVNQGAYTTAIDLSERQLIWYYFNTANDRLGNLDGDELTCVDSDGYPAGGNTYYAQNILANWKGFTSESTLPYASILTAPSSSMSYKNNYAKLVNTRQLDMDNMASVKKEIIDHGAVAASYYHNSSYYALSNGYSTYYNPNTTSTTNHAIAIVGWDDNFAATNFPESNRPSSNGAWLVRNSWSSTITCGSEYTYFYMSYEDGSLADAAYSLDFEPGSAYDNIYQHDGSPNHSYNTGYKAANVYTAENPDNYGSESLDAVMIAFENDTYVNYKVEIYTGLTDESNPESGYLNSSATTYGATTYRGIYTLKLNNPVLLAEGEKYAIVVTATDGSAYFDMETGAYSSTLSSTASSDAGESFIMQSSTSSWRDYGSYGNGNFCIKGLTNNSTTKKYRITYNLNGGTLDTSAPTGYTASASAFTLPTPTKSGYHFLGWYTDSSFSSSSKVISVSGSTASNITLYAKWEAHSCSLTKTVAAKCTTAGYKRYTCSCGYYYDDPIAATGHSYTVTYTKNPTCQKEGYRTYTCSSCSDSYNYTLSIVDHNYQDVIVKATAKKDGYCNSECIYCGDVSHRRYTIYKPVVELSFTKSTYNGSYQLPTVTVSNAANESLMENYHYWVTASSRKSVGRNKVTVTFADKWYDCTITKYFTITPKAPSSASATLYGHDDVKFSWSKSTGASGYYVYYKKASASSYTSAGYTTNTYKKIANLSDGVKYKFKVVPYYKNSAGTKFKGLESKTATVYTLKKIGTPTVTSSSGKAKVKWNNISGETGYQISRSSSKTGTYIVATYKTTSGTSKLVTATKGKGYYYKVRAYKQVGNTKVYGPWSDVKYYKR